MPRERPPPVPAEKLAGIWDQLLERDASKAYAALTQLVGSGRDTVSFLKQYLLLKKSADERVTMLLADLDSPAFRARQIANRELEGMLPDIEPILNKAFMGRLSAEARGRVDALLAKPPLPKGERNAHQLRQLRAVQALEYLQSDESLRLLQDLTKLESNDFLAREAIRAVERLHLRMKKTP